MDYIYHLIPTWPTRSIIYVLRSKKAATFPHLIRENYASNSASKGSHSFETAHALSYPVFAQSSLYPHPPIHPLVFPNMPGFFNNPNLHPTQNRPPPPFVPHSAIFPCKQMLLKDRHMGFHHQLFLVLPIMILPNLHLISFRLDVPTPYATSLNCARDAESTYLHAKLLIFVKHLYIFP